MSRGKDPTADQVCLRRGDRLELRRPDGNVLKTSFYALGRSSPSDGTGTISLKKPPTQSGCPDRHRNLESGLRLGPTLIVVVSL